MLTLRFIGEYDPLEVIINLDEYLHVWVVEHLEVIEQWLQLDQPNILYALGFIQVETFVDYLNGQTQVLFNHIPVCGHGPTAGLAAECLLDAPFNILLLRSQEVAHVPEAVEDGGCEYQALNLDLPE